jgi:hypothetical protein
MATTPIYVQDGYFVYEDSTGTQRAVGFSSFNSTSKPEGEVRVGINTNNFHVVLGNGNEGEIEETRRDNNLSSILTGELVLLSSTEEFGWRPSDGTGEIAYVKGERNIAEGFDSFSLSKGSAANVVIDWTITKDTLYLPQTLRIYRKQSQAFVEIDSINNPLKNGSYTDTGTNDNTEYTYYLRLEREWIDGTDEFATSANKTITTGGNQPPNAALNATQSFNLTAQFDSSNSSDPEGDSLEYRWDPGDGSGFTAWTGNSITSYTYSTRGTYSVTVEVRDGNGGQDSTTDLVTVESDGGPGFE